jgi:hypothetical protein
VGLALTRQFPNCGARLPGEGLAFLGQLYSKIKLIVILKFSETDCLISCVPIINATLAATRMLGSIKSVLRLLHLLHRDVVLQVQRHKQ